MKDLRTNVDIYNEKVNQLQASIDAAFEHRKIVHFDETKTYIIEAIDSQVAQAKSITNGQPNSDFFSPDDPSIVAVDDPVFYSVLLRRSLAKVHPDWTKYQVTTKANSILLHEFDHGGEAIKDPNLEELFYCVMFVEDAENGQAMIQPFVMAKGNVDYQKIASAPGEDQSVGDKAFISNLI